MVEELKQHAVEVRKTEEHKIEKEMGLIRQSIARRCRTLMGIGTWTGVLSYEFETLGKNRVDLRERCCAKIEKELGESEFRNASVRLGFETDGLVIGFDFAHFGKPEERRPIYLSTPGNVIQECAICLSERPACVLTPCGHLCCYECNQRASSQCPFCRCIVDSCVPIFNSSANLCLLHENKSKKVWGFVRHICERIASGWAPERLPIDFIYYFSLFLMICLQFAYSLSVLLYQFPIKTVIETKGAIPDGAA